MSNSQPNAWQTASRNNNNNNRGSNPNSNSNSSSRTPQNRSTTASPSQQNPSQPPKQNPTAGNVWTQRAAAAAQQQQHSAPSSSNGPALQEDSHIPLNGFNAAEVKGYLAREVVPAAYKLPEAQGGQRNSGGAWGSKANHMANGQPFFLQLAKQVATFEGGG